MGQRSPDRISGAVDDALPAESPRDVGGVGSTRYDLMTKVARDARDLLGALNANVDWIKSGFADGVPTDALIEGLNDIETCCERLTSLLEDALVGTRKQGLTVERSILSISSVLAAAQKKVKKAAEAKRVSFEVATECEVVAMFESHPSHERLFQAHGKEIVAEVEPDSKVSVRYQLQDEESKSPLLETKRRISLALLAHFAPTRPAVWRKSARCKRLRARVLPRRRRSP